MGKDKILSAGKKYETRCQSTGSRPPAVLTWWKASKQLKKTSENVSKRTDSNCRDGIIILRNAWDETERHHERRLWKKQKGREIFLLFQVEQPLSIFDHNYIPLLSSLNFTKNLVIQTWNYICICSNYWTVISSVLISWWHTEVFIHSQISKSIGYKHANTR